MGHASKLHPGVSTCHTPPVFVEWHGLCRLRCLAPPPHCAVHSDHCVHADQQLSSHAVHVALSVSDCAAMHAFCADRVRVRVLVPLVVQEPWHAL